MKKLIFTLILIIPQLTYSDDEVIDNDALNTTVTDDGSNVFYKTKKVKDCFAITVSAGVQNCMLSLAEQAKKTYEKEYANFIKKIKKNPGNKSYLLNYKEFLFSIESAKKNWDIYAKEDCLARAYQTENKSYAFYTVQGACLTYYYDKRAEYYTKYQKTDELNVN
ncbi:hypothetical protein [Rouxiella sp. Mn2063]|uniref:hypothetical protein n=1 Tax=Rouxiella sp. Mn2063 TaxID=3395262 RepID=UPI003BE2AFE2